MKSSHYRKKVSRARQDSAKALEKALALVQALNRDSALSDVLRRYVQPWLTAHGDFQTIPSQLRLELNDHLGHWQIYCLGAGAREYNEPEPILPDGFHLFDIPERTRGKPYMGYGIKDEHINDESQAALKFALFVCGPYARALGQCPRCQKYFLNTSGHRIKIFCSLKCARHHAAVRATKARREKVKNEKCKRVLRWYARIGEKPLGRDWKEWISKNAHVKVWWLTRAINDGHLPEEPKQQRSSRAEQAAKMTGSRMGK